MRVALVTDTYLPQVNGVTTVVHRMVTALERDGSSVALVAPHYKHGNHAAPNHLRVASIGFPTYPEIRMSAPAWFRVRAFLGDFRPDVVHVVTEGPLGLLGRRFALRTRTPLVTSYHTNFPDYCRHYGMPSLAPLAWKFLTWFHRPAQLTHTPGGAAQQALLARGLSQTRIWGQGIETDFFTPERNRAVWRQRLGVPDGRVLVLHVGRLAPEKNLDLLIESFRLAHYALGRRAEFLIAGEGPEGERMADRLPWARRAGFLQRDDLADLYVAADVVVLPSRTETCGLVALEAMSSGVPVIAADAGGFRDSVVHGHNGYLVSPDDPRELANRLIALALDPAARTELGRAGRATALQRDVAVEHRELLLQYQTVAQAPVTEAEPCVA